MLGGDEYLGEDSAANPDLEGGVEAEHDELAEGEHDELAETDAGHEHEGLEESDLVEAEHEDLEGGHDELGEEGAEHEDHAITGGELEGEISAYDPGTEVNPELHPEEENLEMEEDDSKELNQEEEQEEQDIGADLHHGFSEGQGEGFYPEGEAEEGHEIEGLEEHDEHLGEEGEPIEGAFQAYEAEGEALPEGEAEGEEEGMLEPKEEQDSLDFGDGEGTEPADTAEGDAEENSELQDSVKSDPDQSMEACPLTTLASAALASVKSESSVDIKSPGKDAKKEGEKWFRVGVFSETSANVSGYYSKSDNPLEKTLKMNLEPGTAYKFRVAAVNSVGQSEWSEIAAFKTSLPGYPGAPSAIKISRSTEGAHLTWQPPSIGTGDIIEYSVYLAVSSALTTNTYVQSPVMQLSFVRVYCGAPPQCVVGNSTLTSAHIDSTSKPAIIFRIAARNQKGYGPATQVRWLQEPTTTASSPVAQKRSLPAQENSPPKMVKTQHSEW